MKINGNPLLRKTPLRQKTPLKRTTWMQNKGAREKKGPGLAQRIAQALGVALEHGAKPPSMYRSVSHRMTVAELPCVACGRRGRSQAAHLNLLAGGKGKSLKASDALVIPLCADGFLSRGCHSLLDQGGAYDKATAAANQIAWLQQTRATLQQAGKWPAEAEADMLRLLGEYMQRNES